MGRVDMEPRADPARIMTVPEEFREDSVVAATGNDFVSLPEIDAWGRVHSVTFLHAGCAGLIEVRGAGAGGAARCQDGRDRLDAPGPCDRNPSAQVPFLTPVFIWNGVPVNLEERAGCPDFSLEGDWMPAFSWTGEPGAREWRLRARIVAPPDEKGFCYVLEVERLGRGRSEPSDVGTEKEPIPVAGVAGEHGGRGAEGDDRSRQQTVQAELGVRLTWGYTGIRVFTSRELPVVRGCRYDRWTHGVVAEALGPLPVFAFALNASGDFDRLEMHGLAQEGETEVRGRARDGTGSAPIVVNATRRVTLAPGDRAAVAFYVAFNREADGARTTGVHLRRRGWEALEAETRRWLAEHRVEVRGRRGGREEGVVNRNLLFCRFFATGKTLDSEEVVAVTSRSPRYYVSAAFWARDVLLWALPGLVLVDRARAREVLVYSFLVGTRHVGDHAQYTDGRSLYPGFELDEAAAFLVGLGTYLDATSDLEVVEMPEIQEGMRRVLSEIDMWTLRRDDGAPVLGRTFLDPSDDQVKLPFLTYDNVLLVKAWRVAAAVLDGMAEGRSSLARDETSRERLRQEARRLRCAAEAVVEAVRRYCVVDGPLGPMYAWAVDLAPASCATATARAGLGGSSGSVGTGADADADIDADASGDASADAGAMPASSVVRRTGIELYDNPPGSLELVGYYGYYGCGLTKDEALVLANTRRWIRSSHNPYFIEGRFAGPSSAHAPHPWPMAAANCILAEVSAYETTGACDANALRCAVEFLVSAPMDLGIACESIDEETGKVKTGAAFATAAGFSGYSLWRGIGLLAKLAGAPT